MYSLIVTEPINERKTTTCALEEGTAESCEFIAKTELASRRWHPKTQFIILKDGLIQAISVHGAMLWLDRVPPPAYFRERKEPAKT